MTCTLHVMRKFKNPSCENNWALQLNGETTWV